MSTTISRDLLAEMLFKRRRRALIGVQPLSETGATEFTCRRGYGRSSIRISADFFILKQLPPSHGRIWPPHCGRGDYMSDELKALIEEDSETTEVTTEEVTEDLKVDEVKPVIETAGEDAEVEIDQTSTDDKPPVETTSTDSDDISWTKAMALDQRSRRQTMETKVKSLEAELSELKRKPRPDALEEPEAALNHVEQSFDSKILTAMTNLSREVMKMHKDDYDAMEVKFVEMATSDPSLVNEMAASPNPAKFAYETAKKKLEREEFLNMDTATEKAKLEAQWKADFEAKQNAGSEDIKEKDALNSKADLPSLATVGVPGNQVVTDKSLEDLFPR